MKKFVIPLCLVLLITLSCSEKEEQSKDKNVHHGRSLTIAVVGDTNELPNFSNIEYKNEVLSNIIKSKYNYDAIIITKSAFPEADKSKYVSFFRSVAYPVFFYDIEGYRYFAFTKKEVTLEQAKTSSAAFVQGFKDLDREPGHTWGFYLPNKPTDYDKKEGMLIRIFNAIDKNI